MKERETHRAAFERYLAQGGSRSLTRLAKELGVSESAVKKWSRVFRWSQRLEERARAVGQAVAEGSQRRDVDERLADEQMTRLAAIQIMKQLVEGKIKATMADVPRIVQLKRLLAGEDVSDDTEFVVTWPKGDEGKSLDELRDELRQDLEKLGEEGEDRERH